MEKCKTTKVTVEFEIDNGALLEGCHNVEDSLHEALCLLIYEDNTDALQYLNSTTTNILLHPQNEK